MFKKVRSYNDYNAAFDVYDGEFEMEGLTYYVVITVEDTGLFEDVKICTYDPFDLYENLFFAQYNDEAACYGLGEEDNVKTSNHPAALMQIIRRAAKLVGVNIPSII